MRPADTSTDLPAFRLSSFFILPSSFSFAPRSPQSIRVHPCSFVVSAFAFFAFFAAIPKSAIGNRKS
jgi:hypothetical protein